MTTVGPGKSSEWKFTIGKVLETTVSDNKVYRSSNIPFFRRKGTCYNKIKGPLPGNRDTVVRACFYQKSTSLVSYPTQNDATDMFYPKGPPKPFLFKIKRFRYKWKKHLSNINDSSSFSVFCLRGSMCLHINIWAGKDSEWRQAHPPASEFVVTKRFHADSKIRTNRNFDRMQMLHNIWHTNRMLMGLWKNRDVGAYTLGRRCRACFAGAFVCCMPLSNNNIVFEVFL